MSPLRSQFIRELVIRGMSERTQEAYVGAVYGLAKHYHQVPDQLTDEHLKDYLFHLARERKLAVSSLNVTISALRRFYEWVLHRPVPLVRQGLPRLHKETRRPRVYSVEELERLFTVGCHRPQQRAFLMTVYGGGLRLQEACHLQVEDIMASRMQIRVRQGKGRKDRYTLLSPTLLKELRAYAQGRGLTTWVFPSSHRPAEAIVDCTGQRMFDAALKRAGLPSRGGIHALRHSFATHLIESGVELTVVQRLLGHSSLTTTSGYLHVSQQRMAQVKSPLQLLDLSSLDSNKA